MAQKQSVFETQNGFSIQIDPLDEKGNRLDITLQNGLRFMKLELLEIPNSVPYYILTLNYTVDDMSRLFRIKNFSLVYTSKLDSKFNYSLTLGVNTMKISRSGNIASFIGWAVSQETFSVPKTRYMKNGALSSLRDLNLSPNKEINAEDVSLDVFQINETDLSLGLRLCNVLSTYPLWYVGRVGIQLTRPTRTVEDLGIDKKTFDITPNHLYYDSSNTYESWKKDLCSHSYKSYDAYGGDTLVALGTPSLYRIFSSDYKIIERYMNFKEFWESGLLLYGTISLSGEYSLPIGTTVKNTNFRFPGVESWMVGSCYYTYSGVQNTPPITTFVQFIGIQESSGK